MPWGAARNAVYEAGDSPVDHVTNEPPMVFGYGLTRPLTRAAISVRPDETHVEHSTIQLHCATELLLRVPVHLHIRQLALSCPTGRYGAYTLGATTMPQALVNLMSAQVGAPMFTSAVTPVIARGLALRDAADRMVGRSDARG